MGTVGYMSPEQVRGQAADNRADIFAFGAILYEMLAGKRAFQKPTSPETMTAILNEDPPGISQVAANIPPALQRMVHRCLEKNPEQRFQSASDLAFDLDALSEFWRVVTLDKGCERRDWCRETLEGNCSRCGGCAGVVCRRLLLLPPQARNSPTRTPSLSRILPTVQAIRSSMTR